MSPYRNLMWSYMTGSLRWRRGNNSGGSNPLTLWQFLLSMILSLNSNTPVDKYVSNNYNNYNNDHDNIIITKDNSNIDYCFKLYRKTLMYMPKLSRTTRQSTETDVPITDSHTLCLSHF